MSATPVLPAAPRRLTLSIVRYCASCGTRVLRLEPGAAPDAGVEFRNRVFCGGCWRVTARMPRIRAEAGWGMPWHAPTEQREAFASVSD